MLFFRNATGYEGVVSNGFCRGCLSGGASWPRLEVAHPLPDTNYCIASSASGCPIELSSCTPLPTFPSWPLPRSTSSVLRTYPRATNHPSQSVVRSRADLRFHSLRSHLRYYLRALPLDIAKGPIRYQNNSHLFVVRPTTPCSEPP